MLWLVLALVSAILTAVSSVLDKKILKKEHSLQFAFLNAIFNVLISVVLFVFVSFDLLDLTLVFVIYLGSWISVIAGWLMLKSTRHEELSSVIPLSNLSPLILLILGAIFLGERLSLIQLGGAMLLVVGVYVLEAAVYGSPAKLLDLSKTKYAWLMIAGVFIGAFGVLVDKVVLNFLEVISYIIILQFFLALNYFILFYVREGQYLGETVRLGRRDWKSLGMISLLTIVNRLVYATAISAAYASLVITVKRLSTLFSTVAGGAFFHEKHLALKLGACLLMIAGVYFVIAF